MKNDATSRLEKWFARFGSALPAEMTEHAELAEVPENTEILREGQYVKVIPIVISGVVKVFTRYNDKELLLYYITPEQSCIMSYSSILNDEPSKVFAVTEEASELIILPATKVNEWTQKYPRLNNWFFDLFNQRYTDLLDTINHLLFNKLDERLYHHLQSKAQVTGKNPIRITHRQLAYELGTAREVVSRILKKLESEEKIRQHSDSIEIL